MSTALPVRTPRRCPELAHLIRREVDLEELRSTTLRQASRNRVTPRTTESLRQTQSRIKDGNAIDAEPSTSDASAPATRSLCLGRTTGTIAASSNDARSDIEEWDWGPESRRRGIGLDGQKELELHDREWEVLQVIDKKVRETGLVEYQVRWKYTKHPSVLVREDEVGNKTVSVDGQQWSVRHRTTLWTDERTGDQCSLIEWQETFASVWQLSNAIEAVAAYEQRHPKSLTKAQRTTQPSFWKLPRTFRWAWDPIMSSASSPREEIPDFTFGAEPGKDYTPSILAIAREHLGERSRPSCLVKFINSPIRQPLEFSKPMKVSLDEDYRLRATVASVVGHARRQPCAHCKRDMSPFVRCITVDSIFNGCCTNCVYMSRTKDCSVHHDNRVYYEETLRIESEERPSITPAPSSEAADDRRTPVGDAGDDLTIATESSSSSSSPPGSSSPIFTPPSSPPSTPQGAANQIVWDALRDAQKMSSKKTGKLPMRLREDGSSKRKNGSGESSQEEDSEVAESRKKPKRDAGFKNEPRGESVNHPNCKADRSGPCEHPVYGEALPVIEDDSRHPPNVVFNDKRFEPGEATDDEIRYIIGMSICENAQMLHEGWLSYLREVEKDGQRSVYDSKEEFLSCEYPHVLNMLVERCCPVPSTPSVLYLTIDDD